MKIGIIVEDRFLCDAIVSSVDWMKAGYELIGVTGNGEEAKKLITFGRPNLLILDLAITDNQGKALSQVIRKVLPDVQIVAVTGNRSFEHASEAALQVIDFIRLPMEKPQIKETIRKILERHRSSYRAVQRNGQLAGDLADYITGVVPRFEELKGLLSQANMDVDAQFAMFIMKPAVPLSMYEDESFLDAYRSQAEQVHVTFMRLELELPELHMIPVRVGEVCAIVVLHPNPSLCSKVSEVMDSIEPRAHRAGRRSVHVFSSRVYYGLIHLRKAFTDTLSKAERDFFTCSLLPVNGGMELEKSARSHIPRWETIVKNPTQIVLHHDLPAIFQDIVLRSDSSVFTAKCIVVELCFSLEHYAARLGVTPEPSYSRIVENVFRFIDLEEAYSYVKQLLLSMKEFPDTGNADFSPVIKSVMSYLHTHYHENIGLSQIADHFNMNASYLSRLLSQETGTTFVDMLAQIRIYHAKVLLREGEMRVKEIGEAVGYRDYSHFYMVFKRIEGTSPKEYIKLNSS